MLRATHTYVELEISPAAFDEIRTKLAAAQYQHTFVDDRTVDMTGIAVVRATIVATVATVAPETSAPYVPPVIPLVIPPVDRSARTLTDGSPVTPDHREIQPDGQQKGYVVLSESERAKGFVRPVRDTYRHVTCGMTTTMGRALAETYARDPGFYSGTFCTTCRAHFPLDEFTWKGTNEMVGS